MGDVATFALEWQPASNEVQAMTAANKTKVRGALILTSMGNCVDDSLRVVWRSRGLVNSGAEVA